MTARVLWKFYVMTLVLFTPKESLAYLHPTFEAEAPNELLPSTSSAAMVGEFITVWNSDTTYTGSTGSDSIAIPGIGNNYDIYWEEVALPSNNGTAIGNGTTIITFPYPGIYRVEISPGAGTFEQIRFNNAGDKHKLLDIEQWGTISWTSMDGAFFGCSKLDFTATDAPDLSGVTTMVYMFRACTSLTEPEMNAWDVSGVQNMSFMFAGASNFNADIGGWDTGSLINAVRMFILAYDFNQDIGSWNTSNALSMASMFFGATSFNQDLSDWDVSSVTSMNSMFEDAVSLDQDFGDWDLNASVSLANMFNDAGLSCENYDSTLIKWNNNPLTPNSRFLGAANLMYWDGQSARDNLINVKNWVISGDSYSDCNYIPPDYEITTTGGNLIITDLSGNGESMFVTESGGDLEFDVAGRQYSLDGGPYTSFPVNIPIGGLTSIEINLEGGNDLIYVDVSGAQIPGLTINGGIGDDGVTFSSDVSFFPDAHLNLDLQDDDPVPGTDYVQFVTGVAVSLFDAGEVVIRASKNIAFNDGSSLTTEDGFVTIEANQQTVPSTGSFYGIALNNASIIITDGGKLDMKGRGGDGAGNQMGVYLFNNAQIMGGNSGLQRIEGYGGPGTANANRGVQVQSSSVISTNGGDLEVYGEGNGTGSTAHNYGVHLVIDGTISAGGSGTVIVEGTGGLTTGDFNHGVYVLNIGSMITSSGGNVTVTGYGGGTGVAGHNKGIVVNDGGAILAGGSGAVSVTGIASSVPTGIRNHGVHIVNNNASIYSSGGDVEVIGLSGGSGLTSEYNHGIMVENDASITAGGMGNVYVEGTGGTAEGLRNDGVICWKTGAVITSGGGDVHIVGQGGGAGTSYWNFGVMIDSGGELTAGGMGNLLVEGTGGMNCSGERNYGVYVYLAGSIITSNGGNVTVTGQGGGNPSSLYNIGILVRASTITAGGAGTVTVNGTGGANDSDRSDGVQLWLAGATITSSGGDVTVNGQGGGLNNSNQNYGVIVYSSGVITSGGTGNVLVQGTGGATGGARNDGVYIAVNATITSSGGNVHVIGQGGSSGGGYRNYGVFLEQAGVITAQGSGKVTVHGTGASCPGIRNYGVVLSGTTSIISSTDGDVSITGQGGGNGASNTNFGVYLTSATIAVGGTGNLFIDGTGGPGSGNSNYGVSFLGNASSVTTNDGHIDIIGLGGGIDGATSNFGLRNQGTIMAGGNGEVNIDATGGPSEGGNNYGLYIDSGGSLITTSGGNLTIIGQGGGSGDASGNLGAAFLTGATVAAGAMGTTTIEGTGGNTGGGTNSGVYVTSTGTSLSSNGGDVFIIGQGGGGAGSGNHNYGVNVYSGGLISVGGTGTLHINGTGGSSSGSNNYGMIVFNSAASVTSADGDILITTQGGGTGTGNSNLGFQVQSQGLVIAGGTGNITLTSTGGGAEGNGNYGILVWHDGTSIQTTDGDITLNGTADGSAGVAGGVGIYVADGLVAAGGTGQVTLNGTGSPASGTNNWGVYTSGTYATVTSGGGDLYINGYEGGGSNAYGIFHDNGATYTTLGNSGNISFTANSINIQALVEQSTTDTFFIQPLTPGVEIVLGPEDDIVGGPLQLSDAELDSIQSMTIMIGNATAGTITIDSNITRPLQTNMTLTSGGNVAFANGYMDTDGGNLHLDPGLSPFGVLPLVGAQDVIVDILTFGSDLVIEINGVLADVQYDQMNINGVIDLTGVDLIIDGIHVPMAGDTFIIVNNDGTDPIINTFNALPEGAMIPAFLGSPYPAMITYIGGTGNDVVLKYQSPDYIITDIDNQLVVTDIAGHSDIMEVSESSGDIEFSVPGRTYSVNGSAILNFPVSFSISGLDTIEINLEVGNDTVIMNSFVTSFPNLRINGGIDDDFIQLNGNINFLPDASLDLDMQDDDATPGEDKVTFGSASAVSLNDSGNATIKVSRNVAFEPASSLSTEDGDLIIEANQQVTATSGNFHGISLDNASIEVLGGGTLVVRGACGDSTSNKIGVYLFSSSQIIGGTTGIQEIEGTGSVSFVPNFSGIGIQVQSSSIISTNGGDLSVIGEGASNNFMGSNYGVHLLSGGKVTAGGAGNVTVEGNGGISDGGENHGIYIHGDSSKITSSGGNITATGQGSGEDGSHSHKGVFLDNGGRILAGGAGSVTVSGSVSSFFGGPGNESCGVHLIGADSRIGSNGGDVEVIGIGGGSESDPSFSYNHGVILEDSASITTAGIGEIHVSGTGGVGAGLFNIGVVCQDDAQISSPGGDILIQGYGGGIWNSFLNVGIYLDHADITAGGQGTITLEGVAGIESSGDDNHGIFLGNGAMISSNDGNISLEGEGGGQNSSFSNHGIQMENSFINAGGSGMVSMTGTGGQGTGTENHGVNLTIQSSVTTANGDISITGQGGGQGNSEMNIGVLIQEYSVVMAGDTGHIIVQGTGGTASGNMNYGVFIKNGTLLESAMGDVSLTGLGGGTDASMQNLGINLEAYAEIYVHGPGNVTMDGTGGNSTGGQNSGVRLDGYLPGGVYVEDGDVLITGQGGDAGTAGDNYGVMFNPGFISVMGGGNVLVNGIGGTGTGDNNIGVNFLPHNWFAIYTELATVEINGTGGGEGVSANNIGVSNRGYIYSFLGGISITGVGGATEGGNNHGVLVEGQFGLLDCSYCDLIVHGEGGGAASADTNVGVLISSLANVSGLNSTINGTGGVSTGDANYGVYLTGALSTLEADGDVHIQGIEGSGSSGYGIRQDSMSLIFTGYSFGNVYLTTNSLVRHSFADIIVEDSLFIQPYTAGTEIKIGPVDDPIGGPLHLATWELYHEYPVSMFIGDDSTGSIAVDSNLTFTNPFIDLTLTSAEDVIFNSGSINLSDGDLHLNPGNSPFGVRPLVEGQDVIADALTFGSDLIFGIEGLLPDIDYDQLGTTGEIDLTGVDLVIEGSYVPMAGDSFVLINNDDTEAILGTFVGLAEGDTLDNFLDDEIYGVITYMGNTGNDVVIRVVPGCLMPEVPILSASQDTACAGETITLTIDAGDLGDAIDWYWYSDGCGTTPEGVGTSIMVSPLVTTTYFVRGEGGCVSDGNCADIEITINAIPDPTIDQDAPNPCYYTNNVFQPVAPEIPGATYEWNFGAAAVPTTAMGYGPHDVYYGGPGPKTVKLVIYPNESGAQCPDSSTINFTIVNCPGQILGKVLDDFSNPIASVHVLLYVDADTNGVADNGTPIRSIFTDSNGNIGMANLTPGHYVLVQNQPSGWTSLDDFDATDDGDVAENIDSLDNLIPVSILPLEIDSMNMFIEKAVPGQITGAVFQDFNLNEIPDPGEGIADVLLEIFPDYNQDGSPDTIVSAYSDMTDAMGGYQFSNIPVGHYVIVETQPPGMASVKDFDASNDGDLVPNTDMQDDTIPFTLINMEIDAHNYFIDAPDCGLQVTNTNDNGIGSLRYALACATDGDTITFHPAMAGSSIVITSSVVLIDKEVVFYSTLMPEVEIHSQITGLFEIDPVAIAEFSGIQMVSGLSPGSTGAAFENYGTLILKDTRVTRNPLFMSGEYLIRNHPGSELTIDGTCQIQED